MFKTWQTYPYLEHNTSSTSTTFQRLAFWYTVNRPKVDLAIWHNCYCQTVRENTKHQMLRTRKRTNTLSVFLLARALPLVSGCFAFDIWLMCGSLSGTWIKCMEILWVGAFSHFTADICLMLNWLVCYRLPFQTILQRDHDFATWPPGGE